MYVDKVLLEKNHSVTQLVNQVRFTIACKRAALPGVSMLQ